ncbi:hypothetical protein RHMOL_Rhmol08G0154500 [Rhododendron molle]|uniref:Uncharacterized protein n=1 Tax=Rhododendron molle TaxID=49168 RepID=A0ACC0MNY7_RHOML|nr:hypothetical protein RHMOL_Rhmol08G0154500 [Rhododendron molle]
MTFRRGAYSRDSAGDWTSLGKTSIWNNRNHFPKNGPVMTSKGLGRSESLFDLVFWKVYKAQRNVIMCAAACLLYWCVYRICKYYKEIQSLEEVEKRYKDQ